MELVLAAARKEIQGARKIVFLGGAGVSTGSGIPDFRSPKGLYNVESKYGVPYERVLSHSYFLEHMDNFYDFYWGSMVHFEAKPNGAHLALSNFEERKKNITILTQNIDGLHQAAGSRRVVELHGSVKRYFCPCCHTFYTLEEIPHQGIPLCKKCGGYLKPDVVLYEEALSERALDEAVSAIVEADLLIVCGTSMNVFPVSGLVSYFHGRTRIIINKEKTRYDSFCDFIFHDDCSLVLEELLKNETSN